MFKSHVTPIVILLIVALIVTQMPVKAETFKFSPGSVNLMDKSSSEWVADGASRTMLTVMLMADLGFESGEKLLNDALKSVMQYDSYVCRKTTSLYVIIPLPSKVLTLIYTPALQTAEYSYKDYKGYSQANVSESLKTIVPENYDTYYVNDKDLIIDFIEYMAKAGLLNLPKD